MTLGSTKDHEPLIKASGSDNLISKDGFYVLIRDERKFENMQARLDELLAEYGLASTLLDREQLQASVSGMRAAPVGAVHWPQSWRSRDPGALVSAYANLFKSRGGTIEQTDVSGIVPVADGWCLRDDFGRETTEHLVVALGPWSPKMLKPLGYHFPMIAKRGYHGHFAPEAPLGAVLVDETNGVVATPMGETIRVTTGASFVRQSAPASYKQYEAAVAKIGEFAPLGKEEVARRWMGARPCMPDMLPVVGKVSKQKNLWLNFGHGHHGFTLGPTTAKLLANGFDGKSNALLDALSPDRFGR